MIPQGKRRQAIDQALTNKWAQAAHLLFLDSFMQESKWKSDELAFHGGTSLHLSWRSPRYSEDLDFLLSRTAKGAAQVVNNATKRCLVREGYDPHYGVRSLKRVLLDKVEDPLAAPEDLQRRVGSRYPFALGLAASVESHSRQCLPAFLASAGYPRGRILPYCLWRSIDGCGCSTTYRITRTDGCSLVCSNGQRSRSDDTGYWSSFARRFS